MITITLINSILDKYWDFVKLFIDEVSEDALSAHQFWDYEILIIKDKILSKITIYSLLLEKLKILRIYLNKNLKKEFIQESQSSAEYSILFILKKNESLWLCVNYWELNNITVKNNYLLSLILKLQN